MSLTIRRSEFLRGNIKGRDRPIRPPWSLPESSFIDLCTQCGDCIPACEEGLLQKGRGGYPVVNFNKGECFFCGDCVEKCNSGSLSKMLFQQEAAPWIHKVQVTKKCLNYQGVLCRSCGDRCPQRAIVFRPRTGGKVALEIELESCNGCGACVAPCPVQAIIMTEPSSTIAATKKTELENCA